MLLKKIAKSCHSGFAYIFFSKSPKSQYIRDTLPKKKLPNLVTLFKL